MGHALRAGLLALLTSLTVCKSVPIQPPDFDYELLARRYLDANRKEHFPLTIQRGSNSDPSLVTIPHEDVTKIKHWMFYTTDRAGSRDIWLRDLNTTVNIPVIEHPAEQYAPAIAADGRRLAYVSEDADPNGDIRIVALKPDELLHHTLEGGAAVNLWDEDTLKLSHEIEKQYETGEIRCRGRARETDPVWHPSGRYLLFVSDRCTPGVENLWKAEQDGLQLKIAQLTEDGAVQPSFSGDGRRIVFVGYRDKDSRGEIYIRDEASGRTARLELPAGPAADPFIYLYPVLSENGESLSYVSVREDTNSNGYLDPDDHGAIYRATLTLAPDETVRAGRETPLVENSSRLFSMTRGFLEESLLYSAERAGAVNVYLSLKDGIVPRLNDIDAQFRLADRYRDAGTRRYLLALDAVRAYFGESLEYLVYEGRLFVKKIRVATSDAERARLSAGLDAAARRNELVRLERSLFRGDSGATAQVRAFLAGRPTGANCDATCRLKTSAARELLARRLRATGDSAGAAGVLRTLHAEDPGFFRGRFTRKLQGELELAQTGRVPPAFVTLLGAEDTPVELKEEILAETITFYYKPHGRAALAGELARTDLPAPVRAALLLARAQARFDARENELAHADAREALQYTGAESGLYIQAYQLIARTLDRRGDYEAAFQARQNYAQVKNAAAGARIDPEEYSEILQEFERRIDGFLRDARALAALVDERDPADFRLPATVPVRVSAMRERFAEFCTPDSYSHSVYRRLGPAFAERYDTFCAELSEFLNGQTNELTLDRVMEATGIFYQAATADANLLNIFFFNLKQAGLMEGLYDRLAIYYHRRKVEIVQERSRAGIEWEKNRFRLLENLDDFVQDEDPFDEGPFNEILTGYGAALPFARDNGDLAMIYGAAYAMIQRSLERERLYDSILEEGAVPPDDSLRAKKETILRDLKIADYHLQYILYVDPAHTDAYLLRGWLYEYIEYRRGLPLGREPDFFTRSFNFVTFTTAPAVTEGDFYASSFDSYFPDRLYEENIESYRQALERLGRSGRGEPGKTAALHLNLANNYFHLLNFKRALEHYEIVVRTGAVSFVDYRQEALFRYNRGRSLFYEGRSRAAATEFETALRLYEEHEHKPLSREHAGLVFALEGDPPPERRVRIQNRLARLSRPVNAVRVKLALLAAMLGLARWESGEYDAAILAYQDARRRLSGENAVPGGALADTALLNFIALSYQDQGDLNAADRFARQAGTAAVDLGLGRDDARYRPGSLAGRVLGCFISYGEDFSVIGDGRNPYGFAPLRHYHLALGIQLENMILRGDLEGARELLQRRRAVFAERDGDVQLGQLGVINTQSQEAFLRFSAGDYAASKDLFRDAAERARATGSLALFERNFYNYFYSIFALLERNQPDAKTATDLLRRANADLATFRENYHERTKAEYIAQKKTEFPEFEYEEERDDPALAARVAREIVEAEAIQGALAFYAGQYRERFATGAEELRAAHQDYLTATSHLDRAYRTTANQFGDESLPVFRLRINRALSLAASGKLLHAQAELKDLAEKSFEFNLVREDWEIRWRLADVLDRLAARQEPGGETARAYRREIAGHLDAALRSAAADLPAPPVPDGSIEAFYDFVAAYYVKQNEPARALQALEQQWQSYLRREYARYPLRFQDAEYNTLFHEYRELHGQVFALARAEQELRLQRRPVEAVRRKMLTATKRLEAVRARMSLARPAHAPFLEPPGAPVPRLDPGQTLLRLFVAGDSLAIWKFKAGAKNFVFTRAPAGTDLAAALREALRVALADATGSPVLIVDHRLFALPVEAILLEARADLDPPVFATRVGADHRALPLESDRERSARVHVLNQRRVARGRDNYAAGDLVVAPAPAPEAGVFTLARDHFPFREWLGEDHFASAVFFATPGEPDRRTTDLRAYRRQGTAYEALRAAGTGSMATGSAEQINRAIAARGAQPYARSGLRVFGSPGAPPGDYREQKETLGRQALTRARQREAMGDFQGAHRLYELALSYFWKLDAPAQFEARLGSLRTEVRLSTGSDRDLVRLASGRVREHERDDPRRSTAIRSEVHQALYLAGRTEAARLFLAEHQVDGASSLPVFLTRLRAPVFGGQDHAGANFRQEFLAARPSLLRRATDRSFLKDFLRHALYAEGAALIDEFPPEADLRAWRAELDLDAHLLRPDRYLAAPDPARLQGRAREFFTDRPAPDGGAVAPAKRFGLALRTAWRTAATGRTPDLADLGDFAIDNEKTVYAHLDPLERAILFRLLIDSLASGPGGETAGRLKRLIAVENEFGRERAALMNLAATRAFLAADRPDAALAFFQAYTAAESQSIPDRERATAAARLGLALPADDEARAAIEKTLVEAGEIDAVELHRKVPATIDQAALTDFAAFAVARGRSRTGRMALAWRDQVLLAVAALKSRANGQSRQAELFNLAVWEESLRTRYPAERGEWPAFQDLARRLPAGPGSNQVFIALIEVDGSLMRLALNPRGGTAETLTPDVFDLRFRVADFLQRTGEKGQVREDRELGRLYRSFFSPGQGRLTYYWAAGIHALAPVHLDRTDRIFQVLDPTAFVAAAPRRAGGEFTSSFRVRLIGQIPGEISPSRATMERFALGEPGPGPPYHRIGPIGAGGTAGPGAWFYQEPQAGQAEQGGLSALLGRQALVRARLAAEFSGPGVYTVQTAPGQSHAFFLKFYYSPGSTLSGLRERFLNALAQERARTGDGARVYGYHLATTCPLLE